MTHLDEKQLSKLLEKAKNKIRIGDIYYHYKNPQRYYVIDFVGLLEASEEPCVAYRALYGKKFLWVRTFNEFTKVEEINGRRIKKFTKVDGVVRLSALELNGEVVAEMIPIFKQKTLPKNSRN